MKYCYECGQITAGEPLFCRSCGRSYDVKLCPRLHANPRYAEVCSQCGSRELSTPQPKVSLWWKLFGFLLQIASAMFLAAVSLLVLLGFLRSTTGQNALLALGLLLMALWALWTMLPDWLRRLIHRSLKRKEKRHER